MGHCCIQVNTACRTFRCGSNVFVRGFHTLLSLGIPATLIYKNSDLKRSLVYSENLVYGVSYVMVLAFSLCMYWTACLINPGYIEVNEKTRIPTESEDEDEDSMFDTSEYSTMIAGTNVKLRQCVECGVQQPLRARHCEDCNRCVNKYDHHCPWLETCVGERNHKFFWLFISSEAVLIWWTMIIAWRAIVHNVSWDEWFYTNWLFVLDIIVLGISGITVTGLFCFHTYLMFTNQTTWEVVSRERITYLKNLHENYNPFHQGYCKNMCVFLCRCAQQKWTAMYAKKTENMPSRDV